MAEQQKVFEIDPQVSSLLFEQLEEVRQLRGVIERQRVRADWVRASYSAGKPWFAYHEHGLAREVRQRARIVERWFRTPAKEIERGHGVLSVSLEYIKRQRGPTMAQDIPGPQADDDSKIVFFDTQLDTRLQTATKIRFLNPQTVSGTTIMRADTLEPYSGGIALSTQEAVQTYYAQKPLLEEDYRTSMLTPYDIGQLVVSLGEFIEHEQRLSEVRIAAGARA